MRREIKIGISISAAIIVIWLVAGTFSPAKLAANNAEGQLIANAAKAANRIKLSMRDPDSFKLTSVLIVPKTGSTCYEYRSRNGFGGMNEGRAVLSSKGVLTSSESQEFRAAWENNCSHQYGTENAKAVSLIID